MGIFGDLLWSRPDVWGSIETMLDHLRNLPLGIGESQAEPGIQGIVWHAAINAYKDLSEHRTPGADPRAEIAEALEEGFEPGCLGGIGTTFAGDDVLALYDRPEELRDRMVAVAERFYEEFYKPELPNRRAALERSIGSNRSTTETPDELARRLIGRPDTCIDAAGPGGYEKYYFSPSIDTGPYAGCAIISTPVNIHALFYPCEPEFIGQTEPNAAEIQRMSRLYKALSDEQRLRILNMLRDGEMYAQEIVDRLGLHQSVVSRHLSFLKVVGLVLWRRENNMKYFSLNPAAEDLMKMPDFVGAAREGQR
jgi:DNA-binding transcriptional ArsR family regulator